MSACSDLNKEEEIIKSEDSGWDGQPYDELTRMKNACNEEKAAEAKAAEAKEVDEMAAKPAPLLAVRQDASKNLTDAGGKKRGKKSGKKTRKKRVTRRR